MLELLELLAVRGPPCLEAFESFEPADTGVSFAAAALPCTLLRKPARAFCDAPPHGRAVGGGTAPKNAWEFRVLAAVEAVRSPLLFRKGFAPSTTVSIVSRSASSPSSPLSLSLSYCTYIGPCPGCQGESGVQVSSKGTCRSVRRVL